MNHRMTSLATTTILALTSGMAVAADECTTHCGLTDQQPTNHATSDFPDSIAHPDTIFVRELAQRMLPMLPPEQKEKIIAASGIGSDGYDVYGQSTDFNARNTSTEIPEGITATEFLNSLLGNGVSARLNEQQLKIVNRCAELLDNSEAMPYMCFAPDVDPEFAFIINQLLDFQFVAGNDSSRYQQGTRWSRTATDGSGLVQGDPTIITYSFAPDGSFVGDSGLGSGNSTLFQWLNGLYGNTATWQALYAQIFANWSELGNVTYVLEPNDDGRNMSQSAGVLGVRGDVRLFAFNYPNDGNGGVLAYNFFPNDGDMAIDAFDTFYNSTFSNSIRFRNVVAHEHGHGLGFAHVCPANATKLMEPFISTSYDGPQLDDILNIQRGYGDLLEPNDTPLVNETDLGSFGGFGFSRESDISIDDNTDVDYFRITVTSPSEITISADPAAATYTQGPQTQACNTGNSTNYNAIQNLKIDIYDVGNVFVPLQTEDSTGTGGSEDMVFNAIQTGDYIIRISPVGNINNVQLYDLTIVSDDLPFLNPTISATAPDFVDPGMTTDFPVTINANDDTIVNGSELLNYRINGGSYATADLTDNGGGSYTATIPAANCDDTVEFYVSVEGDTGGVVTLPSGGAGAPFDATVGSVDVAIADDFETNMGWTITGNVSGSASGQWERSVPSGDGSRGDPSADFDGSGRCYITGNGSAGSNTDVDGGQTILNSPTMDLSDNPEAVVSYARWYDNTGSGTGAAPGEDIFTIEISDNNGGSWTELEVVGPLSLQSAGGWFTKSFRVADFVSTTSQVRVRFIAEDLDPGSVIEAGVDAFDVTGSMCEDPTADCPADFTGEGDLDIFDLLAFLDAFNAGDSAADFTGDGSFDIFDLLAFLDAFNAGCP